MTKALLAASIWIVAIFSGSAYCAIGEPAEVQAGMWWSPQESGRGYAIDAQGDKMVVTTFAYDDDGSMQWYFSPGDVSAGGYHWCGPLLKFNFGQPLNGIYIAPVQVGNDGTMCMDFTSRVAGTVTMPGGRKIAIQRQNFGVGDPPSALLGGWLFAYSIGSSSFADVYLLTQLAAGTSTGTGLALDPVSRAGFEYQTSGVNAGLVEGVQIDSSGNVLNAYLFQLQMEEGRGAWVSPLTNTKYGMNAYKLRTPQGINKRGSSSTVAVDLKAKGVGAAIPLGVTIDQLAARDSALAELAHRTYEDLQGLKR